MKKNIIYYILLVLLIGISLVYISGLPKQYKLKNEGIETVAFINKIQCNIHYSFTYYFFCE
jgi:hypothetical protein